MSTMTDKSPDSRLVAVVLESLTFSAKTTVPYQENNTIRTLAAFVYVSCHNLETTQLKQPPCQGGLFF